MAGQSVSLQCSNCRRDLRGELERGPPFGLARDRNLMDLDPRRDDSEDPLIRATFLTILSRSTYEEYRKITN